MILADSNIWMALAIPNHPNHPAVDQWMYAQPASGSICFCRATQQSFLRLITTDHVMRSQGEGALSNEDAWKLYDASRQDPRIGWLDEPAGIETQWRKLASRKTPSPKLLMDAYLAAFAIAGRHQ